MTNVTFAPHELNLQPQKHNTMQCKHGHCLRLLQYLSVYDVVCVSVFEPCRTWPKFARRGTQHKLLVRFLWGCGRFPLTENDIDTYPVRKFVARFHAALLAGGDGIKVKSSITSPAQLEKAFLYEDSWFIVCRYLMKKTTSFLCPKTLGGNGRLMAWAWCSWRSSCSWLRKKAQAQKKPIKQNVVGFQTFLKENIYTNLALSNIFNEILRANSPPNGQ